MIRQIRGLANRADAEGAREASAGRRQVVICATVHGASPARALLARLCRAEPPQAPRAHAAALAPRARAVLRGPRPRLLYRRVRAESARTCSCAHCLPAIFPAEALLENPNTFQFLT